MDTTEKVAAVLNGTLKRFTYTIFLKDGRTFDIQSDDDVRIGFHDSLRQAYLQFGYSDAQGIICSELAAWTRVENKS